MCNDIVEFSQDIDTVEVQSEVGAATSLVKSSLGCMKLHCHSGGLGAKDDGVHSLRVTMFQTSSVGAFLAPCPAFGLAWSGTSWSY